MHSIWQDFRYGLRIMRRSPGFTAAAILTLALGIGANTSIFQLLDAVRFRALPVSNPQELVDIGFDHQGWYAGHLDGRYNVLTNALWEQIRDHQQAFSGAFAWGTDTFNLSRGGEVRYAQGLWVSGDFFNVLGVQPAQGRLIANSDDRKGCGTGVAVLGYWFWQREYGASPAAVGRTIWLNGFPVQIIGITPESFFGVEVGRRFDVAVPICAEPAIKGEGANLEKRNSWWLAAMGRLKPGWTVERASAHLDTISPALFQATLPPMYDGVLKDHYLAWKLRATPVAAGDNSNLRDSYENPLQLLLAATGVVLLIACANLANLLLARASVRRREIAIRLAIGASRVRLVRQLFTESFLLVATGSILGVLAAQWISEFLVALLDNPQDPIFMSLGQNSHVLLFTVAVASVTCLLFGLAPAWQGARADAGAVMKSESRGTTGGQERSWLRRTLVVSQVALSLGLLVGALLLTRTLGNLLTTNAGFKQDGVLLASLDLTALNLPLERRQSFRAELNAQIRSLPGVDAAADQLMTQWGDFHNDQIRRDGAEDAAHQIHNDINRIAPGYFNTLEIPIIAGRDFTDRDSANAKRVAIVNEFLADAFWKGQNPIGRIFYMKTFFDDAPVAYEVVGLVGNTKYEDLRDDFSAITYFPRAQESRTDAFAHIYVRSAAPFSSLMAAIKKRVAETSPLIGVEFRPLKSEIRATLLRERLMAILSGFFGLFAALLAAIGVYAVMSFAVVRRTGEIGIRMALGAERHHILRMVLRESALLVGVGLCIGTALALGVGRAASSLLYGVKPYDLLTLGIGLFSLSAIAGIASYLPARRATRVDPMTALRHE
jgi:predicted permease